MLVQDGKEGLKLTSCWFAGGVGGRLGGTSEMRRICLGKLLEGVSKVSTKAGVFLKCAEDDSDGEGGCGVVNTCGTTVGIGDILELLKLLTQDTLLGLPVANTALTDEEGPTPIGNWVAPDELPAVAWAARARSISGVKVTLC